MSGEDLAAGPATSGGPGLGYVDIDQLHAMLAAEQAARQHAEAVAAKAQDDLRDIAKLRDNFHNLYREERELREAAERGADAAISERNRLESDVVRLQGEVDRLQRAAARPAPPVVNAPAAASPPPVVSAAPAPTGDAARLDLERELGVVISHAAELEAAMARRDAELAAARAEQSDLRAAAERADRDLLAARAALGVLEQRLHDAERAREAAEQRAAELAEELAFVQSSVLTGRDDRGRRGLLRRRPAAAAAAEQPTAPGHVEAIGTPVPPAPVEVRPSSESVDEALHRRLFGDG